MLGVVWYAALIPGEAVHSPVNYQVPLVGVPGLLVTGSSLICSSLISPDGALTPPLPWGFALKDPAWVPEVMVSGWALEAVDALLLVEVLVRFLQSLPPVA